MSFEDTDRSYYKPTPEEIVGIDRGLRDAEEGRFATDEEVEQAFAKFRGAPLNGTPVK